MTAKKALNKKQMAVLEDLVIAELDDAEIIKKHRISYKTFRKWLSDDRFVDELNFRMNTARLKSRLIIARYSHVAAMKLVELVGSEKEETARKACLDVMSSPAETSCHSGPTPQSQDQQHEHLTPDLASKLLAILAQTDNKGE